MTDEQKRKKAQRERERRARIKEQRQAKQDLPTEPVVPQPEPPKDWDLTYSVAPAVPEPTQLDRIEALLVELVESNRRLHPNISELLNSGIKR